MAILRLIGSLLILVAVIVVVSDATQWQARKRPTLFTSLERHLAELAPQALASTQSGLQRIHRTLWDPTARTVLQVPTWIAFGAGGLALCYVGRRRRRVNVFAN